MSGAHWCLVYHLGISGPGLQLPGKARKSWYAVPIFMKKLVRIMCILLETRDGVGGGEKNWGLGGGMGGLGSGREKVGNCRTESAYLFGYIAEF